MDFAALKNKALLLPTEPGVYIMKDKSGRVIYVGKAKKLKNRVSQYFQDTASHTAKTRQMVETIDSFDVIVAASEFEALVLECSLIKQHMPKYNILLKDGKGYPFLRLDMRQAYPTLTLVGKPAADGALYFGPFGSRGVTNEILQAIRTSLKLPNCTKQFPRDIGKERPCLHYHMGQCAGWCQNNMTGEQYRTVMEQVRQLLSGKYKEVADQIRADMTDAAEQLNFELAASLRDSLNAVETLGRKQLVTAGSREAVDVIGYSATEVKACFSVLHFADGNLVDKDYAIVAVSEDPVAAVSTLVKQYYLGRGFAPRRVLLPFEMEDMELFEQLIYEKFGKKTSISTPQRGDKRKLIQLACKNAAEEAERITQKDERLHATVDLLGKMLGIQSPRRIEAYDISNIAGTDIVAGMIVFADGKPRRSEYKKFKIKTLDDQDDYSSMCEVLTRRFTRFLSGDAGFDHRPDLLLIDGGIAHAGVAVEVIRNLGLDLPVFGMVKDNRHRTRALVTSEGEEIGIDTNQSVYSLIGNIQEETHRFAITFHRSLRSKRLRYSELDGIPGVGAKRKQILLRNFKSLNGIAGASLSALEHLLPKDTAAAVYQYFRNKEKRGDV